MIDAAREKMVKREVFEHEMLPKMKRDEEAQWESKMKAVIPKNEWERKRKFSQDSHLLLSENPSSLSLNMYVLIGFLSCSFFHRKNQSQNNFNDKIEAAGVTTKL